MRLHPFQPDDHPNLAALWNRFWKGTPRGFEISPDDFARRVLAAPTFADTTLLATEEAGGGFVHFGPGESWGFRPEDRLAPNRSLGLVYALCAEDETVRNRLLQVAETQLRAAGARRIALWPTWAQGTIAFYNGLSPSNEISGLWTDSRLVAWAQGRGYTVGERYRLGVLDLTTGRDYPPLPEGAEAICEDFPTPIIPGAQRLSLRRKGRAEEIGRVVYVGAGERNRALGTRECAAFDVLVTAAYRGQGWGRALMGETARQAIREGYTSVQLHVVEGNTPAENLYFRSLGFAPVPEGRFLTLFGKAG